MTAPVRWGVLSTANIGRRAVIPALHASRNGEVVAVASRDLERARRFAAESGIPRAHGSYEALLDDENVDAVYIPLPNNMHAHWTIRAARAGKHVLCEKPLGVSADECVAMAQAAAAAGVRAMEAFMYRFHPRTDRLRALVAGGAIGAVRSVYAAFTFHLTRADNIRWLPEFGGGSLMDVGCYCVNVCRTLLGREPEEVQASATWTDRGIDAQMAGMLRFDDGVVAQFDSALSMERREAVHVAGVEGHLELARAFVPGTGDVTIEQYRGHEFHESHLIRGADQYRLMVERFAECVLRNVPVPYHLREGAANMRVIEALYRSARNGGAPEPVQP